MDTPLPRNLCATATLKDCRAILAGERRYLKEALVHIDATLAMMVPGFEPTLVKAKFPRRKSKLFGAGKLNHLILGVLRKADRPMTQREIVTGVRIDAGFADDAEAGLRSTVRSNLLYLTKVRGMLVKQGDWETALWSLKADSPSDGWRRRRRIWPPPQPQPPRVP